MVIQSMKIVQTYPMQISLGICAALLASLLFIAEIEMSYSPFSVLQWCVNGKCTQSSDAPVDPKSGKAFPSIQCYVTKIYTQQSKVKFSLQS